VARPETKPRILEEHSNALKVTLFKTKEKIKEERMVKVRCCVNSKNLNEGHSAQYLNKFKRPRIQPLELIIF